MDTDLRLLATDLPDIPLIDVGAAGTVALLDAEPGRLAAVIAVARGHYGRLVLRMGDTATRQWLTRNRNPYAGEIAEVARRVALPGAYLLNLSYEWSCTTAVAEDSRRGGNQMLRTLDWPLGGLGRNVVVARQESTAGPYYSVTWPGFVGVLTAMAPGRFSAAINQPPMRRMTRSCWFDWAINRTGVWRRSALPPTHLLRRVFDSCETYAEAKDILTNEEICIPAFFTLSGHYPDFTLSGHYPDEACIIERLEHRAAVHEAPTAIANHWLAFQEPDHDRGNDSFGRLAMMRSLLDEGLDGGVDEFSWVTPPILNHTTRLAVVANASAGTLRVQGWEADGPATGVFSLPEPDRPGTA